MCAHTLAQIPHAHNARAIATNQLALIGMDDDIVDGRAMHIIALQTARPRIPDFHRPILGTRHHPFSLAVERDAGDVVGVALKCHDGVWVGRFDVVQFDIIVARCC